MKIKYRKIYLILWGVVCIIVSAIFVEKIFSFDDIINHPLLARKSIEIFNASSGNKISSQEIGWIMQGAQEEDTPIRWMNHFYNPETGAGLFLYSSAKDWAGQNVRQSLYFKGDQTWQKAINSYTKGNEEEAFIALGHSLHLLEDMAVPAHTRIDIHLSDPLENWAKYNADGKFAKISATKFDSLEGYFNSLASYSNRYFLSEDTIDYKLVSSLATKTVFYNDKNIDCSIAYDSENKEFCIVSSRKSFLNSGEKIYYFTDKNNSDYYSLLAPKAISYGAGMIDLFFKEAEKKKTEEAKKNLLDKLKNILFSFLKDTEPIEQNIKSAFEANKQVLENSGGNLETVNNQRGKVLSASISAEDLLDLGEAKVKDKISNPVFTLPPVIEDVPENEVKENEEEESFLNIFSEEEVISPIEDNQPTISNPSNLFVLFGGDATRPETTIEDRPEKISSSSLASFIFSSSKTNSSFQYNLNNNGWVESDDILNLTELVDGQYVINVRAFDSYRNFDESPAIYDWTIDTIAPTSTVKSLSADYPSAEFMVEWESGDTDVSKYNVQYKIEEGDWQEWIIATTSLKSIFNISVEEKKDIFFRVQSFDEVGNLGEWSSEKKTKIIFIPEDINDLSAVSASSTPSTIKLSWTSPDHASSSSGSFYDLRYKIKAGACDLNEDWDNAVKIATSSLPTPAIAGEIQEYIVGSLLEDTEYCFAMMVYNGEYWSNLSNQIYEKTLVAPHSDIIISNTSSLVSEWGTSTLSWLHTIEAGDEMLFVSAYWQDNNKNVTSAKFAGIDLIKIIGGNIPRAKTNNSTWYLVNPPVGEYRVEFKFTASMRMAAAAINLGNIDTDNPISTSSQRNAQSAHILDTINAGNNNSLIIDSVSVDCGTGSLTADLGQTETFNYRFSYFDGTQVGLSYKEAETVGSYETGWVQTNNNNWTHTLAVINPKP